MMNGAALTNLSATTHTAAPATPSAVTSPSATRNSTPGAGRLGPLSCSAPLANRVDELPLAHLGPPGDPFLLRDLVELLPVAVLQRVPGLAAALAATPGLLLEASPSALRQRSDRPLLRRRLLRLLDVLAGGSCLLRSRHHDPPSWCASMSFYPAPEAINGRSGRPRRSRWNAPCVAWHDRREEPTE